MDIFLPMLHPPITSYPSHANILSSILQYPAAIGWVYNHYIQLFTEEIRPDLGFYMDFTIQSPWKTCPWIEYKNIATDHIRTHYSSIVDFVREAIDQGDYIFINLDQYYIPPTANYQVYHFTHDTYLFGYNQVEQKIHIADFFRNLVYSLEAVSYSELEAAFNNADASTALNSLNGILLIKSVACDRFVFDIDIVREEIRNYLNATPGRTEYTDFNPAIHPDKPATYYGLKVYDKIAEYLELLKTRDIKLTYRVFHVLYDHKVLMRARLEYLVKQGFLPADSGLPEQYAEISEQALMLQNMMIRYSLRRKPDILDRTCEVLKSMQSREESVLGKLLNYLGK
jgi:hypothetical protein